MWRRMNNTVYDCAGSKTTLLPEEYGGMIINETGTAVRRVLEKNEKKKYTGVSSGPGQYAYHRMIDCLI